jgi:hypothetical protein
MNTSARASAPGVHHVKLAPGFRMELAPGSRMELALRYERGAIYHLFPAFSDP